MPFGIAVNNEEINVDDGIHVIFSTGEKTNRGRKKIYNSAITLAPGLYLGNLDNLSFKGKTPKIVALICASGSKVILIPTEVDRDVKLNSVTLAPFINYTIRNSDKVYLEKMEIVLNLREELTKNRQSSHADDDYIYEALTQNIELEKPSHRIDEEVIIASDLNHYKTPFSSKENKYKNKTEKKQKFMSGFEDDDSTDIEDCDGKSPKRSILNNLDDDDSTDIEDNIIIPKKTPSRLNPVVRLEKLHPNNILPVGSRSIFCKEQKEIEDIFDENLEYSIHDLPTQNLENINLIQAAEIKQIKHSNVKLKSGSLIEIKKSKNDPYDVCTQPIAMEPAVDPYEIPTQVIPSLENNLCATSPQIVKQKSGLDVAIENPFKTPQNYKLSKKINLDNSIISKSSKCVEHQSIDKNEEPYYSNTQDIINDLCTQKNDETTTYQSNSSSYDIILNGMEEFGTPIKTQNLLTSDKECLYSTQDIVNILDPDGAPEDQINNENIVGKFNKKTSIQNNKDDSQLPNNISEQEGSNRTCKKKNNGISKIELPNSQEIRDFVSNGLGGFKPSRLLVPESPGTSCTDSDSTDAPIIFNKRKIPKKRKLFSSTPENEPLKKKPSLHADKNSVQRKVLDSEKKKKIETKKKFEIPGQKKINSNLNENKNKENENKKNRTSTNSTKDLSYHDFPETQIFNIASNDVYDCPTQEITNSKSQIKKDVNQCKNKSIEKDGRKEMDDLSFEDFPPTQIFENVSSGGNIFSIQDNIPKSSKDRTKNNNEIDIQFGIKPLKKKVSTNISHNQTLNTSTSSNDAIEMKSDILECSLRSSRVSKNRNFDHCKVSFTKFDDDPDYENLKNIIVKLGGHVSNDVGDVLVAKCFMRTFKFLKAASRRIPIVSSDWLYNSNKLRRFADPFEHLLKDKNSEKRFQMELKSIYESRNKFLSGYTVYLTPNIFKIPREELIELIQINGGKSIVHKTTKSPKIDKKNKKCFTISCPEDQKIYKILPPPFVSIEIILKGILIQKLDIQSNLIVKK